MAFKSLGLDPLLLKGVEDLGFTTPTGIQAGVIAPVLEGLDVLGQSQTGTGKTAAFGLPLLHQLLPKTGKKLRALVITPTRELAYQVHVHLTALARHTPLHGIVVTGGTNMSKEEDQLRRGADWCVATPGRLIDHLRRRSADLTAIKFFVLDEADRMLDMGFMPDVRQIVSYLPEKRQTLLFSATLPPQMKELAHSILDNPVRVDAGEVNTVSQVNETVWPVSHDQKYDLLKALLERKHIHSAVIFTRTKMRADRLGARLLRDGIRNETLHGDHTMRERVKSLERFSTGRTKLLVATDLAARGIDVSGVTHVINYDVPVAPEDYIHRVGRTARAGASGDAMTFMSARELTLISRIEGMLRKRIPTRTLEDFVYEDEIPEGERPIRGRRRETHGIHERPHSARKRDSPFTSSGKARKEFAVPDAESEKKKKNKPFKIKKRLPHER